MLSFPIENLLIERRSGVNLHRQVYRQLRAMIEERVMPSGAALPSTRVLAKDLQLARNTVIATYEQLALEGFIELRRGRRPVVTGLPTYRPSAKSTADVGRSALSDRGRLLCSMPFHHGEPGTTAFHPGMPDAGNFPFNTWSRLLARRAKQARTDLFGSYHIPGHPMLCEAIARYLAASRGVVCSSERIVITAGAQSAFDILARLLTDPGDTVWMEEPGYYGAASAFRAAGARLVPLRVTDAGWSLDPPAHPPRVIFVTPSCQHPLGLTMAMEQRLNLIRLADKWGAWIIEDDYDSEYRFQGRPIPALQGTAPDARVVFVGTFAKILFPAMRLGYMVVPASLRQGLKAALSATGQFAPLITQAALADFMNDGHLTRHLRRMRGIYAERRQFFIEQLDRHLLPWIDLHGTDSGIQLVGLLRKTANDRQLAASANRQGINVSPLSMQYHHKPVQQGLLMGFAAADQRTTVLAMIKLSQILKAHCGPA